MSEYRDASGRALADYPRPSVAVDTALLTVPEGADALHVLLVRRTGGHEPGRWALPGSFLHVGERLADAVLRSLRDKAGVAGVQPRQLHVFDDPGRDDRGWVLSVAHCDVVAWSRLAAAVTGREDVRAIAADAAGSLPFDHVQIVRLALRDVRARYADRPDPDGLLGEPFTLLELRRIHEAVGGAPLPKDTFRRHMQAHLISVDAHREGVVGKPARLYVRAP